VACGWFALAHPGSVLYGGLAWVVVLLCTLAGYGAAVERLVRVEVDLGLRLAWGTAVVLALCGIGFAGGVLVRPVVLGLIGAGVIGFGVRQWTVARPTLLDAWHALPGLRARPALTAYFAVLACVAAVNLMTAVADTQVNTYDDDVIYTPLAKRTLQIGNIDEPFSFRRLGAFGGQTALVALAGSRGCLDNVFVADGGVCQFAVYALLIGAVRRRRRDTDGQPIDTVLVGLFGLVVVVLPNTSINSGSHWSGVLMFYGLYRTLALTAMPGMPLRRLFVVVGGVAAAACTLRQNYIPVAVLIPFLGLAFRLWPSPRERFRVERTLWLVTIATAAAVLIPYCIASYRSSETFLYPLWGGTFNPSIPTTPTLHTTWQEIQFWFRVILEPEPIRTFLVLLPVMFVARDLRAGKPLTALSIAGVVGMILLVHSFTLSDARTMWRYAFGFMTPLFFVVVLEGAGAGMRRDADEAGPMQVPLVGRMVVIISLLIQISVSARGMIRRYEVLADDLQAAAATHAHPRVDIEIPLTYARLQAAAPAGAAIAVALDEPAHLDYARNQILNLDSPGFASYDAAMPTFQGPEPLAAYFLAHDIRYLGFVRGAASRYQFRREFWLKRIFLDTELWRVQGAYTIDAIESYEALAASRRVLFEHAGMVMVDLAERRP
jgi:hypothetical protein